MSKMVFLITGVGLLVCGILEFFILAPSVNTRKKKRRVYIFGVVEFFLGIGFLIIAVFGHD